MDREYKGEVPGFVHEKLTRPALRRILLPLASEVGWGDQSPAMWRFNLQASASPRVVRVRPSERTVSRQGVPGFLGISGETAGCQGLSLNLIVIPPGGKATPHRHVGYETALYMLAGRVETRYGAGLRESVITEPGDFLFIPAGVPHQPVNLSSTEEARAVVARNDAAEDEHVEPYDPASE